MKRKRNKKVELSNFEKETLLIMKITLALNFIAIIIMLLK